MEHKKMICPKADYRAENQYMQIAIDEAREGIFNGDGGPFGSCIVKDGKVVGQGHNRVLANNDSTCHGEIDAIRNAEQNLQTYDLSGCVLYTTGEPCPMCLAACMWANIETVCYGCTIEDNAMIGFRDKKFDAMFGGRGAFTHYLKRIDRDSCRKLFGEYASLNAKKY
jgi:guanine deaminase